MSPKKMSPEEALEALSSLQQGLSQQTAGAATAYDSWRAEFGVMPGVVPYLPGKGPAPVGDKGYTTSPTGKILYANGVIADPTTGTVEFGALANDATIEGSPAWLAAVQDKGEEWANDWRKTLWDQGYQGADLLQSETGGMAQDLIAALRTYHTARYSNFGKVQPVMPTSDQSTREAIRKSFDFQAEVEEAKSWGQVPFGEDLDPNTAEFFAERVITRAQQLAKKHPEWSMEQIQAGATTRVQKEFVKDPSVKGALKDAEREEMDDSLRQSIVSISQLGSI
jgi:hypothetical protein